ncbi:hypothetical protein HC891_02345 [Candidatus Gracilibacteria bacterium]|nr:hypothetical protein [Candidatus Gracilibacteria bacterium]
MIQTINKTAVILLGRGGYSGAPRRQLARLVAAVESTERYLRVIGAQVDQAERALPQALDVCAASGATQTLVLPVFVPGDANLEAWLAKVARRWQANNPKRAMAIVLGEGLGDHPALEAALVATVFAAEGGQDVRARALPNWEHNPAGWSVLPTHQYHLLTCRGPRCTALGADSCWAQLNDQLAAHGLRGNDERVLVAATGCLYPCNRGPVLVVYPDGVWYSLQAPDAVAQIVTTHLVGRQPLAEYRIVPGRVPEQDATTESTYASPTDSALVDGAGHGIALRVTGVSPQ